tara:strand:- start:6193 stop:6324 length:132 start_codon:yes stop_codon:yes gene_type:complete
MKKNKVITIRVSEEEKKLIKEEAKTRQESISAYILNQTINKEK